MRVVNAVVILSVLTISAGKCGQANAEPGFWDSNVREPVYDTEKVFSYDNHNKLFDVESVFSNDKVKLDKMPSAKDLNQGYAGHSTRQQEDHVPDNNQQRQSSMYGQQCTCHSSSLPQQVHNHKSVNQGGDDFVQQVDQLIVFNASKNLQQPYGNGQTNRRGDSSVSRDGHPDNVHQQTDQQSRPYGQSSFDRQSGQDKHTPYNRQQGGFAQTGRQPVNQGVNQPSGSYGQSYHGRPNEQGVFPNYNRQPESYELTGIQPVNDRQGVNQPSGSYGQSSYDKQNGQGVYDPYNRQHGSYAQSERPFANDGNTEQVNPNNDQSKNNGVNYNKDWDIYSSVPLTEVSSSDVHKKLAGTVKLPGGVSSVSIEKSPRGLDTSSFIKYGDLAPKGAVIISTNQRIGS